MYQSTHLSFAIPNKNIATNYEWEVEGIKYRNVGIRNVNILGATLAVYNVVSEVAEVNFNFIYSEDRGVVVIGISHTKTGLGRTYLLSGKYGFAMGNNKKE